MYNLKWKTGSGLELFNYTSEVLHTLVQLHMYAFKHKIRLTLHCKCGARKSGIGRKGRRMGKNLGRNRLRQARERKKKDKK